MWNPADWFDWIKVAAFIVGLTVGTFALSSTSWVWLRKQIFTWGAGWLSTLGSIMIGMSIWQSIHIEGIGVKAVFQALNKLEEQVEGTRERFTALERNIVQQDADLIKARLAQAEQKIMEAMGEGAAKKQAIMEATDEKAAGNLKELGYSDKEVQEIMDALAFRRAIRSLIDDGSSISVEQE